MNLIKLLLMLSTIVASVVCISVPIEVYHRLILDRCFNETEGRPLILGQIKPMVPSIDNLISLIEKIESKLPQLNAKQIVILILKRFHIDGIKLIGLSNMLTREEIIHKTITEEIMRSSPVYAFENIDFPEDALTEDEKCSLFFILSHTLNETALNYADAQHVYQKQVRRRPFHSVIVKNTILISKRPREKGVAIFKNDNTTPISMNRVLLGTAVGLIAPPVRNTSDLIHAISGTETQNIPNRPIDPLIAVTISDMLGIDNGSGFTISIWDVLFGATGNWDSNQTTYTLNTNETNGTMATLAEFRGGVDGWNIGRKVGTLFQTNPNITLSQILRQYYSARGLAPDSGVCNRNYGILGELQNTVQNEAENYIRVWNGVYYEGAFFDNQLTGFIAQNWPEFYRAINKAGDKTSEELVFCNSSITDPTAHPHLSVKEFKRQLNELDIEMEAQLDEYKEKRQKLLDALDDEN